MKLGIALGSGAARGWSHVGVLEELNKAGIFPDYVTGTSMGALVGGVYASGNLPLMHEAAVSLDIRSMLHYFFELGMHRSGLLDGRKVADFISRQLTEKPIEELEIPFRCVAADLMSGEPYVFKSGSLLEAIRASISMPGVFTPVYFDEKVLVDGGIINPIPVDELRAMGADVVIAVDIDHGKLRKGAKSIASSPLESLMDEEIPKAADPFGWLNKLKSKVEELDPARLGSVKRWLTPDPVPNIFDVIGNSFRIMEMQITEAQLKTHPPEVLIRPEVGDMNIMDFNRADEAIEAGREAALAALPEIRQHL